MRYKIIWEGVEAVVDVQIDKPTLRLPSFNFCRSGTGKELHGYGSPCKDVEYYTGKYFSFSYQPSLQHSSFNHRDGFENREGSAAINTGIHKSLLPAASPSSLLIPMISRKSSMFTASKSELLTLGRHQSDAMVELDEVKLQLKGSLWWRHWLDTNGLFTAGYLVLQNGYLNLYENEVAHKNNVRPVNTYPFVFWGDGQLRITCGEQKLLIAYEFFDVCCTCLVKINILL